MSSARTLKRALAGCVLLAAPAFAERWSVQYFYDQPRATLALEDLVFPTADRGIAAGTIYDSQGRSRKEKFVVLTTGDGGAHWSMEPFQDHIRSLFFLDGSTGWMVTDKAIWLSSESGRNWTRICDQPRPDRRLHPVPEGGLILRVWFLDAQHGFAVGLQKTVLESRDGGRSWAPVAEAAKPAANAAFTAYTRIAFDGSQGLIVGGASPPRPEDARSLPAWLAPEQAIARRQVPNLTLLLQTLDGGANWHGSTAPLFGVVTSLRLQGLVGLAVMEFSESFEWPSEVHRIDLSSGKDTLVFRRKDRRVTSAALFAGARSFLAAVEPTGRLNSAPIPGKVKILSSASLDDWREMDVDYKAVARSVVLAGPDAAHLWCATDTGMILHLESATGLQVR